MAVSRQMSLGNSVFSYLESKLKPGSPQEVFDSESHTSQLLQGIWENYQEGKFCDVTLIVNEIEIKAHKVVLASFSLYFKGLFDSCWKEKENESIVVHDLDERTLSCLLNFAYTGKLTVDTNSVLNLLAAADFLQLHFVKTSCSVYLKTLVNRENCLGMLFLANKYNALELENYLLQYAARHFYQVSQSDDFLDLPVQILIRFLQSESLVIDKGHDFLPSVAEQESAVFESVLLYASHQPKESTKPDLVVELLQNVRLLLLEPSYLNGVLSNEALSGCPRAIGLINQAINSLNSSRPGDVLGLPKLLSKQRKATEMSESHVRVHACGSVRPELSYFDDCNLVTESDAYLKGMKIWIRQWDGKSVIGGMKAFYSNGALSLNGDQDPTSEVEEFQLKNGERIVKVDVNSGWMVDCLKFHSNEGRIFGPYGGSGGSSYTEEPKGSFGYLGYVKGAIVNTQGKLGITRLCLVWREFLVDC